MSIRLKTKEEKREARLKFYKDDVFVIAHKALQKVPCTLGVEEIFCEAERLANHLLTYEITDMDLTDFELREYSEEFDNPLDLFMVLTVTFVKLCALRKVNPLAEKVARSIVPWCRKFEGFHEMLGELAQAEHKLMVERGRIDLYHYELKYIAKENPKLEQARETINKFVNSALDCDADVIKNVMVGFAKFNEDSGHLYDEQSAVLTQGYMDKVAGREARKIEYHINKVEQLNGMIQSGAQVVHTHKNE